MEKPRDGWNTQINRVELNFLYAAYGIIVTDAVFILLMFLSADYTFYWSELSTIVIVFKHVIPFSLMSIRNRNQHEASH